MLTTPNLSREFQLAAACCVWPPSERRNARIRSAAEGGLDWNLFLRIVERQRIAGMAQDGLACAGIVLPSEAAARLASDATKIARNGLALASEAIRLQGLFDSAGLTALFLKGTTLAKLAYGNIAIKHAWDIDLLVAREDLGRATSVLHNAGYERFLPPPDFSDRQFLDWAEFAHESIFRHAMRGISVELHWRLAENPNYRSGRAIQGKARSVEVSPGHSLKTLADEDLFSYLCLHGAHHGWSRLKWLGDLAAWLVSKDADDIECLYREAKARGAGRAPDQALLLCEWLLDLPLPARLQSIRSGRATRWLASIALNAMAGGGTRQIEDRKFGNLQIELSQFLLADGPGAWLRAWRSKSIGWNDYLLLPLPRPLFFLYPILRVPSWFWRRAAHLSRRRRAITRESGL